MADVLALFGAAVITLGGGLAYLRIRAARRARDAQRALRGSRAVADGIAATDEYIRRVNSATSAEELGRLENERRGNI